MGKRIITTENLEEDSKVFIRGRVSEEDEAASKLICESVIPFEQTKKELWLQYSDKAAYLEGEEELLKLLEDSDGEDSVIIYCRKEKAIKNLPSSEDGPGVLCVGKNNSYIVLFIY